MLTVEGLCKRFGGYLAVNQVSFDVRAGEIFGLIGPNGSGKSTTFNLIAGNLRPSSGSIRFDGKEIGGLPAHAICHLGDRADVPDSATVPQAVADRECHARCLLRRGRQDLARGGATPRRGDARVGGPSFRSVRGHRWIGGRSAQEARVCARACDQTKAPARR